MIIRLTSNITYIHMYIHSCCDMLCTWYLYMLYKLCDMLMYVECCIIKCAVLIMWHALWCGEHKLHYATFGSVCLLLLCRRDMMGVWSTLSTPPSDSDTTRPWSRTDFSTNLAGICDRAVNFLAYDTSINTRDNRPCFLKKYIQICVFEQILSLQYNTNNNYITYFTCH